MGTYSELRKEFNDQQRLDKLTRKERIVLDQAWLEANKQFGCAKCSKLENLTLDHIVPRELMEQFGVDVEREHDPGNIQVLCQPCNKFKANRLDFTVARTKTILQRLLDKM